MKIKRLFLLAAIVFAALCLTNVSCKKTCGGMGKLKLKNTSLNTIQKIMVDGVNYGSIDPNEVKEISLAPGEHTFQFVGISGGNGCSAAKVIIVECKTSSFTCSN